MPNAWLAALVPAVAVFTLVYLGLMVVEALIHKFTHNPDRNYSWGVWLFAVLSGIYVFINELGR